MMMRSPNTAHGRGTRVTVPPWQPSAGSCASISYAKGAHPTGNAVLEEISTAHQAWNPDAPAVGPWGGVVPQATYGFYTINAYCGAAWSETLRKVIFFGAGHAAVCVPVPFAFDLATLSWEWLAEPVPSDGYTLLDGAQADASAVAVEYGGTQFDTAWGDWQGSYSGWPSGFEKPGKVFPETGHSYSMLVVVPGASYGNTNGALLWAGNPTGSTTGTDMKCSHFFDLDTGSFTRCANKHANNGNAAGGTAFDVANNKVYFFGHVSSTVKAAMSVLDVATKTWSTKTASAAIDLPIDTGGMRVHAPSGLLLFFCPERADSVAAYDGIRHRIYAVETSAVISGTFTWAVLTVSAASWPLHTNGKISGIGWEYCPVNKSYYAVNGVNGSTTLWKLAPPVGAVTAGDHLSGTWTVSSETFSGSLISKTQNGANGDSFVYNRLKWDALSSCLLWFSDYYEAPVQAIRPTGV
jgi:hypothetical protein